MIRTPFSLSSIKVLACFIRFEKFQICVISLVFATKHEFITLFKQPINLN